MQAADIATHYLIDLRCSLSSVSDVRKRTLSQQRDNATLHRWQSEVGLLNRFLWLRSCDRDGDFLNWLEEMPSIRSCERHILRLTNAICRERVEGAGICEIRRYQIIPGQSQTFLNLYLAVAEVRESYSPCGGFWRVEGSRYEEILHIWPYADSAERQRCRAQASQDERMMAYAAAIAPLIVSQSNELFVELT